MLSDYFTAYEAVLPVGAAFDAIWRQVFTGTAIGFGLRVGTRLLPGGWEGDDRDQRGKLCPVIEVAGER